MWLLSTVPGYQAHLHATRAGRSRRRGQAGGARPLGGVRGHTEHAAEAALRPRPALRAGRPVPAALPAGRGRARPLGPPLAQSVPLSPQRAAVAAHTGDPIPVQSGAGREALGVSAQPAHDTRRPDVALLAARVRAVAVQPTHLLGSVAFRRQCRDVLVDAAVAVRLAGPLTHHVAIHHGGQCRAGVLVPAWATAAPPSSAATTTTADGEYTLTPTNMHTHTHTHTHTPV